MAEQTNLSAEAELAWIDAKRKEYIEQGIDPGEAQQQATLDYQAVRTSFDDTSEEAWKDITKKIGWSDFIDDLMRRGLGVYKKQWQEANPGQTIDFKLHIKTTGGLGGKNKQGTRLITTASLILEIARNGNWKVFREKKIGFTHIREMRDGHAWKQQLYQEMYWDLMMWGLTSMIKQDAYNHGELGKHTPDTKETSGGEVGQG